jgi:hypothetical protein
MHRTRGRTNGSITRLMSPSDLGEILKPFVFLDLFDHEGASFNAPLHPHSGIATLTYVVEGAVNYVDPDHIRGTLQAGGVEWMQAGRGMWHGGGLDKAGRTRGFQLWIALPPALELGPTISIYQPSGDVRSDGPARVLLGSYGSASSVIASPSPINYLAVCLKVGERWRYEPRRATPSSGPPSRRASCRRLRNCDMGTSLLSSRQAKRSNSKRGPIPSSFSARPLRTNTIVFLATASINWPVIRSRLPALRTLPSST